MNFSGLMKYLAGSIGEQLRATGFVKAGRRHIFVRKYHHVYHVVCFVPSTDERLFFVVVGGVNDNAPSAGDGVSFGGDLNRYSIGVGPGEPVWEISETVAGGLMQALEDVAFPWFATIGQKSDIEEICAGWMSSSERFRRAVNGLELSVLVDTHQKWPYRWAYTQLKRWGAREYIETVGRAFAANMAERGFLYDFAASEFGIVRFVRARGEFFDIVHLSLIDHGVHVAISAHVWCWAVEDEVEHATEPVTRIPGLVHNVNGDYIGEGGFRQGKQAWIADGDVLNTLVSLYDTYAEPWFRSINSADAFVRVCRTSKGHLARIKERLIRDNS